MVIFTVLGKSLLYPIYAKLGGPQSRPRHCGEHSSPNAGNATRDVQLVQRRYTD
jgi:hypothetical protein